MLTLQQYIDKSLELGSKSYFTSKAQQKDALDYLNRAYECVRKTMVHKGTTPQERWSETYYLPMYLHLVKDKHRKVFENLSIDCDVVFQLLEYRNQFKSFEIIKPSKKNDELTNLMDIVNEAVSKEKEFPKQTEVTLQSYIGKDLYKRVSYNWHYVTNSYGTTFIRVFWFLDGQFTKLSTILSMKGEN